MRASMSLSSSSMASQMRCASASSKGPMALEPTKALRAGSQTKSAARLKPSEKPEVMPESRM
jgi:hypothetical protein